MSDSKSKIKASFAPIALTDVPAAVVANCSDVCVDVPIRLRGMPPQPTPHAACEYFLHYFAATFGRYAARTVWAVFDHDPAVPARKRAKQRDRKTKAVASMARRGVPLWTYDGVSPVLALDDRRAMPPWERVTNDRRAYRRAQRDVATLLTSAFTPPAGCRLVVVYGGTRLVVEAALDGRVLATVEQPAPVMGEADLFTVVVARERLRVDAPERPATTPLRGAAATVPPSACRAVYEPGAAVIDTRDTDALVFGFVAAELLAPDETHALVVALGPTEYYDMTRVRTMPAFRPFAARPWDFVAVCAAGGNDYVKNLCQLTHRTLFAQYATYGGPPLVRIGDERATLDVDAYRAFVRHVYASKVPRRKKRARDEPEPIAWDDVLAALTPYLRESMPVPADLHRHVDGVAFSLLYAAHGADGGAPLGVDTIVPFDAASSF